MANNTIDYRVKFAVESKELKRGLREIIREEKEFKRQQREAFKNSGVNEGMSALLATAKKFAPAVSAATIALETAKKAIQSNNYLWDEWERAVAAAQGSFTSFANSLAHADFSNFIDNMSNVVTAAREAATALQDLDDAKMFGSKIRAEIDYEAEGFYSILKNKNASQSDVQAAMAGLEELRVRQENAAADTASANLYALAAKFAEILSEQGIGASAENTVRIGNDNRYELIEGSLFEKYFKDLSAFRSGQARFERFRDDNTSIISGQKVGYVTDKETGETIGKTEYKVMRAIYEGVTGDIMKELFGYYNDALSELTFVRRSRNQDMRVMSRWTNGGTSGTVSSAAEGSIAALQNSIREAEGDLNAAADAFGRHAARRIISKLQEDMAFLEMEGKALGEGLSIGMTGVGGLTYGMVGSHLAKTPIAGISAGEYKDTAKASETAAESVALLTDTIGQLGILSNITTPEVQQFTRSFGSILSMIGQTVGGPWGIALQGIGGIVSSFSGGGVVGGTSYKGDRLLAAVNSGEMILNGYQQKQLLDIISSGGGGGVQNISAVVRGEDMYLVLSNYKRRTRR